MRITRLSRKTESPERVESQQQLQLLQGYGIEGDRHAQPGSPRQVLILDESTLTDFGLQPGDLQENILLDQGLAQLQSGQGLQIGAATIRITFRCEPCAYLDTLQPGLAKRIGQRRGWLGMVVVGGAIAVGNAVQLAPAQFPPLSDQAKERFNAFVATIPPGRVVTTKQLILALGVTPAYYRVLPGFIRRAPPGLPLHRIVAIDGSLISRHLPTQMQLLAAEGIEIQAGKVESHFYWQLE
ncbi:MAG: MGMT family protein [Leptolyngbyaceae cyanobacterium bins.349]|nr:MGMT family protein [Leptolyngbyaceae cyanobacterium bins.349]